MARLSPRRLTGAALRLSAQAGRLPLLSAPVRANVREQVGLAQLRAARIGEDVAPLLRPPPPSGAPTTPDPTAAQDQPS